MTTAPAQVLLRFDRLSAAGQRAISNLMDPDLQLVRDGAGFALLTYDWSPERAAQILNVIQTADPYAETINPALN